MKSIRSFIKTWTLALVVAGAAPLAAEEMESFDPDAVYQPASQDDLAPQAASSGDELPPVTADSAGAVSSGTDIVSQDSVTYTAEPQPGSPAAPEWADPAPVTDAADAETVAANDATYGEDDLIGAAEGVFGKGAEGLARMIEKMLKEQGRPNGYIVGREAGGAFVVGVRYGSGTLHHKVEGERKVYWTGPSVGFDAGANAANTFVLVYNLYDSEELYERYPAGEGQAYVVGGLTASYLRKGDVVLIPIRMGAGLRLGVNAGYMKFSKNQRWLPF